MPTGQYAFRFSAEPPDATLNGWANVGLPYDQDNAAQKTISASKVEYDASFPFLVSKTKGWRDADPSLDDDELKRGDNPIYFNSTGWEDRSIVEKRNATGLPLQTRQAISETNVLNRYTAFFYEGLAPNLVGTVDNAVWDDAAILTGENAPNGTLDPEGRWTPSDGYASSPISDKAHSGRWGIRVIDNPGVIANIYLRGGATLTTDYVVSAWILCETANKPQVSIQRFKKNGTGVTALNTITITDPVGQTFASNKWQRYELRVTVAQLKGAENLFATLNSGDYIKIKIGSGPTASDGRKAHLDDIVCRPAGTTFSLAAYDAHRWPTHAMDNSHFMKFFEYDAFGNPTGVRDDRFRIYSSQATHNPGEND